MKLFLYNTDSAPNTINKVLENELELDINFKDTADIIKPVIKLKSAAILNHNYAYIPELSRYYFINGRETFPNGMITLKMEVDVLESYKADILQSTGTATRGKFANKYYDGGDYRSEVRNEHRIYNSDTEVLFKENTILVTIGG
jgi:hypothetical protein